MDVDVLDDDLCPVAGRDGRAVGLEIVAAAALDVKFCPADAELAVIDCDAVVPVAMDGDRSAGHGVRLDRGADDAAERRALRPDARFVGKNNAAVLILKIRKLPDAL